MSSAQSARIGARIPTRGYSQVPNSLIENQAFLTRPELSLCLIVVRRGGLDDAAVPVSDDNWTAWTGLSPRAKEYAEAGLRKKGTLEVSGRGRSARYSFKRNGWDTFVSHSARTKPHTEGRQVGSSPSTRLVHQACAETCSMLRAAREGLRSLVVTPLAQPVAQTCAHDPVQSAGQNSAQVVIPGPGEKSLSASVASPLAQPVAQTQGDIEALWARSLGVLRAIFPLVGVAFMLRLIAVARAVFANVTDEQLARAVGMAWSHKRTVQKSEGLFLVTVPDALKRIMRVESADGQGPPGRGAIELLDNCVKALARLDRSQFEAAMFERQIADCSSLRAALERTAVKISQSVANAAAGRPARDYIDFDANLIEGELQRIEGWIYQAAAAALSAEQHAAVESETESELSRLGFSPDQPADDLRAKLIRQRTLSILAIPRLSLYV